MDTEKSGPSFLMRLVAVVVLIVAALLLVRIVVGLVAGVFWFVMVGLVLFAVFWAWSTLRS